MRTIKRKTIGWKESLCLLAMVAFGGVRTVQGDVTFFMVEQPLPTDKDGNPIPPTSPFGDLELDLALGDPFCLEFWAVSDVAIDVYGAGVKFQEFQGDLTAHPIGMKCVDAKIDEMRADRVCTSVGTSVTKECATFPDNEAEVTIRYNCANNTDKVQAGKPFYLAEACFEISATAAATQATLFFQNPGPFGEPVMGQLSGGTSIQETPPQGAGPIDVRVAAAHKTIVNYLGVPCFVSPTTLEFGMVRACLKRVFQA